MTEADGLRWPHPLVREAVWADLLPWERDRLEPPGGRAAAEPGQRRRRHRGRRAAGAGRGVRPGGRGAGPAGPPGSGPGRSAPGGGVAGPGRGARSAGGGGPAPGRAAGPDRPTGRGSRVGEPVLEHARHDEHADLVPAPRRGRGGGRRWARAEDLAARAGRPADPRSLMVRADAAHGAGRVCRGGRAGEPGSGGGPRRPRRRCAARRAASWAGSCGWTTRPRRGEAFAAAAQTASEHGLARWRVEALFGLGSLELLADERSPSMQRGARPGRPARPARPAGPGRDPARRRAAADRRTGGDDGAGGRR